MTSPMDVAELARSVAYTRIVSYVGAGSIAVLVYDTFLTWDREYRTIWRSKLTTMKFTYLLTRYSAVLEAGVVIALLTLPGEWYKECALVFKINVCLFAFGLGAGKVIMTIRTWAVWRKNNVLTYALSAFYLTIWIGAFVATGIFLTRLEFKPDPRTAYVGYYATRTDPIIFIPWVLLLVYDAVMFVLMAIPAFKAYRSGSSSRFLRILYRDGEMLVLYEDVIKIRDVVPPGVVFYLYAFVISFTDIAITLTFPTDLVPILSLMSLIVHTLLACRVVLHIDEHGREIIGAQETDPPTNIANIVIVNPLVRSRSKSQTQSHHRPYPPSQYWQPVYANSERPFAA